MNLLSDINSDLAMAIILDNKHSQKLNSSEALELINKINEILEPISTEQELRKFSAQLSDKKIAGH